MHAPFMSFLSRRDALVLLGTTSNAHLIGGRPRAIPTLAERSRLLCTVRPKQTESPYFVDEQLHRSDIRPNPANGRLASSTPFVLTIHVSRVQSGDCQPLPDAQVDVWHCDATVIYSGVRDPGFNTVGKNFLRGYQMTDARRQHDYRAWRNPPGLPNSRGSDKPPSS